jgi:predicted ATP-binding protein involved in virulence
MRLTKLTLRNFRCFESFEITLHPELTVLIAPNGSGKSTVLDAARVALSPFVKGFDLGSQTGKNATIQVTDARLCVQDNGNMEAQLPCSITATGNWPVSSQEQTWTQTRERIQTRTNTLADAQTKALTALAKTQQEQVRDGQSEVILPLVSYLGTSRLWFEGRFSSVAEDVALNTSDFSRTSGYLNCLTYASSFKTFTTWYGWVWRSYREEQMRALENNTPISTAGERFAAIIAVVKRAVNALLMEATGWRDLEYRSSQNQQLVMQHDELGIMPVEMLSDGVRNAISMVADIAFRACKLNPHLRENAALETPGIVLIDEVDMFLHPSWQQTIVASLRAAFPRIQFIVTTHSPQVLSTVDRECIRLLGRDGAGGWRADLPDQELKGVESAFALNDAMHVNPVPPISEAQWLADYTAKIETGSHDDADGRALRDRLVRLYGAHHPVMLDADRLIRFQAFKLRRNAAHEE